MVVTLPAFLTPLVGREQELATLEQLLRHANVRLLTLTGPGGVGKTRLAVAAASSLQAEFPGGITFTSLVPITNPEFVLPAAAAAMGIQGGEDAAHTALERLARFVGEKTCLLILDNFERVVEGAAAIPELLAACPGLKIVATSRQSLRVRGEQEFAVPLLGLPDFERLGTDPDLAAILLRYSAVRLFLDRMRALRADYEPDQAALRAIGAICVRLDGLPLAIELAAARTRMFSPEQLLAQLSGPGEPTSLRLLAGGARDLPARQRTLSRTIQWSYDLLSPEEQSVFRAASIFADSLTLPEAENMVRAAGASPELPLTDLVASLLDKNLLRQAEPGGEPRFRLLVMLQAFGQAEAARLGEKLRLEAEHAATFLELAEAAVPALYTRDQVAMTARLRRDLENLRQALRWTLDHDELVRAARFGAALWRFWLLSGLLSEGLGWLRAILARLGYSLQDAEAGPPAGLSGDAETETVQVAELLYGLGNLLDRQSGSRHPDVIRALRHSRDLYRQVGSHTRAALATTALARAQLFLHADPEAALRQLDDSFPLLQAAGHKIGMAENLRAQSRSFFYLNESDKARQALQQSMGLFRDAGSLYELAHAVQDDGDFAFARIGGYSELRRYYDEAAEMFAALGNVTEAALARASVSVINAWVVGDWAGAGGAIEEGRRVAREHGNERAAALVTAMASWVYAPLGRITEAKGLALDALRAAFALSHESAAWVAFIGLANAERLAGNPVAAVAAISALLSYRTHTNSLTYTRGNSLHFTGLSQLQDQLDPAAFAQAWSSGPQRLAEWIPQAEAERIHWPLTPIPGPDTARRPTGARPPVSSDAIPPAAGIPEPLTERERDVLRYLVEGLTDPQIARALVVSPRTVHAHLRSIYGKLGVNSRTAATRLALERGLV
jgi:predicted ATPase/DNA-binding CsgD family transcriptional regulator